MMVAITLNNKFSTNKTLEIIIGRNIKINVSQRGGNNTTLQLRHAFPCTIFSLFQKVKFGDLRQFGHSGVFMISVLLAYDMTLKSFIFHANSEPYC